MSISEQFRIPLKPAEWLLGVDNALIAKFHPLVDTDDGTFEAESPRCWAFEFRENGRLYLTGFFDNLYISEEISRFWVESPTSPFMVRTFRRCYRATREHSFTEYNDCLRIMAQYSKGAILSSRDVANKVLP